MMFSFSCSQEALEEEFKNLDESCNCEEANFSEGRGILTELKVGEEIFSYEKLDSLNVFNGDILLKNYQIEQIKENGSINNGKSTSAGIASVASRWPAKTVYYTIDPYLSNQNRVFSAIAHWEANTDINFVQRTNQPNYINFVNSTGCASYIGMIGGKQEIFLANGCATGNTIHEIGHALGLFHEHTRADRDIFININWGNIISNRQNNFEMYNLLGLSGFDNGTSLDFNSIMMYGSDFFSNNGSPTITKKNGATFAVQRSALYSNDVAGVNQIYNAVDLAPPTSVIASYDDQTDNLVVTWNAVPGATKYYMYNTYSTNPEKPIYSQILTSNWYDRELQPKFLPTYRIWISARDNNGNTSRMVEATYSWR